VVPALSRQALAKIAVGGMGPHLRVLPATPEARRLTPGFSRAARYVPNSQATFFSTRSTLSMSWVMSFLAWAAEKKAASSWDGGR
jgi:hypothetical protein